MRRDGISEDGFGAGDSPTWTGAHTFTDPVAFAAGTTALPSLVADADDTGVWWPADAVGGVAISVDELETFRIYRDGETAYLKLRGGAGDASSFLSLTTDGTGHGQLDGATVGYHYAPGDPLGLSFHNREQSRTYFGTCDQVWWEIAGPGANRGSWQPFDYTTGIRDNILDIGKIGTTTTNGARIRDLFAAGNLYGASLGLVGAASADNAAPDVVLERDAAGVLGIRADVTIDGDLDHDGTLVGFYGAEPVAKQTVAVDLAAMHAALVLLGVWEAP